MSGDADNLVLEHLRHIRAAVDLTNQRLTELTFRVGMLENSMASVQGQYGHVANRIDRLDERLERIEHRIGLIEA